MTDPVLIIGAGKIGRLALDAFASNDVMVYGFLEEKSKSGDSEIAEVVVLGDISDKKYLEIIEEKTEVFVALEHNIARKNIINQIKKDYKKMPVNAVHSRASVSEEAVLSYGTLISAGAVVNSGAKIGNHCVILSNAVIDVEAKIGEFVEVGAGAIVNSEVEIGNGAFIGAGATIVSGIKIGKDARVGAGSVVIADVPAGKTVFGNPAAEMGK